MHPSLTSLSLSKIIRTTMTNYSPGIQNNEKLKEFIVKFYKASDKAPRSDEQHDPYLDFSPLIP